ncbi:unnamed protein product [Trichobilharzia regenti]|nr:unnamed protein product [Trichobilharzia regenti]
MAAAQANRALKSGLQNSTISDDASEVEVENKKVGLDSAEVEELIRQYLLQMAQTKGQEPSEELTCGLSLFTTHELERGLRRYVDRGLSDAINHTSSSVLNKTLRHLRVRKAPEERIVADILSYCYNYSPVKSPNDPKKQVKSNTKPADRQELEWSLEEDEDEQVSDMLHVSIWYKAVLTAMHYNMSILS